MIVFLFGMGGKKKGGGGHDAGGGGHGGGGGHDAGGGGHGGGGGGHGGGHGKKSGLPTPVLIVGTLIILYLAGVLAIALVANLNIGDMGKSTIATSNDIGTSGSQNVPSGGGGVFSQPVATTPPGSTGATQQTAGKTMTVHTDNGGPANLRASGDQTSSIIGTIPNGEQVTLVDGVGTVKNGHTWFKVQTSKGTGYMAGDLLQ